MYNGAAKFLLMKLIIFIQNQQHIMSLTFLYQRFRIKSGTSNGNPCELLVHST